MSINRLNYESIFATIKFYSRYIVWFSLKIMVPLFTSVPNKKSIVAFVSPALGYLNMYGKG